MSTSIIRAIIRWQDQWIPQGPLWGGRPIRLCFDERDVALALLADLLPIWAYEQVACSVCGRVAPTRLCDDRQHALAAGDWNVGMFLERGLRALHRESGEAP